MGIQIELIDNPAMVYYPGQTVKGRVIICNSKPTKTKGVTISLEGRCKVDWKERENTADFSKQTLAIPIHGIPVPIPVPSLGTKIVDCSAEETYICSNITLVGNGENFMMLTEGPHSYSFSFDLPNILPSTFTSHVGQVLYLLRAEMKRPLLKLNDKVTLPLTVNGILDLNLEAGAGLPQKCRKVKEPSLVALRTGELSFVLHIPERSGFVPGEILEFQAEITNNSNQNIKKVTASLQRITKFLANGRIKTVQQAVAEIQGPEVRQRECETWIPSNLCVPSVVPTKLGGGCHLIDVQYCLHFEMKISGFSTSLSGQLPVLIGNIPLDFTEDNDKDYEDIPLTPLSDKSEVSEPGICPQLDFQPPMQITPARPPPPTIGFVLPQIKPSLGLPEYMPMPSNQPTSLPRTYSLATSLPHSAACYADPCNDINNSLNPETVAKNRFPWDAPRHNPTVANNFVPTCMPMPYAYVHHRPPF